MDNIQVNAWIICGLYSEIFARHSGNVRYEPHFFSNGSMDEHKGGIINIE